MAAGLAHELNNPAAAAQRAASQLRDSMRETEKHAIKLRAMGFDVQKSVIVLELRDTAGPGIDFVSKANLTPLQRADLEDEMADWLQARGVEDGCLLAPSFIQADIDIKTLCELSHQVEPQEWNPVVCWLAASLRSNGLTTEIERASASISALVQSVKSYSHLDTVREENIDLHDGLESTLLIMKHKLRGIDLQCVFDRTLPLICARANELNQVWTNLIDNAADVLRQGDKVKEGAQIGLRTGREGRCVFVEISDNGPGIPKEIMGRVFEPFFTTKSVGTGTGLGLDIAHRIIVERHGGEISCESSELGTTFHIRVPIGELGCAK
ncbi:HAMP domain-containing histidine kinase [bacterium]|nr:MAG: HAMP domain-containing histidine kinase [bacterium]